MSKWSRGDPLNPSDDCNVINSGAVRYLPNTLSSKSNKPIGECGLRRGDGQTNATSVQTIPIQVILVAILNIFTSAQICTYVTANPTSPLALADCDNGGINNIIECQTGGDPLNAGDDCPTGAGAADTICARIALKIPTGGLAMSDCDGDGQTNATECTNNTDPTDPCSNTIYISTNLYLCFYSKSNEANGIGGL
ncbi:MAG: hypothetical protein IPH96_13290 [Saprospiraceae bacterium]|nr:hypothetical protein [Saprospiraceae bacterium]